MNGLAIATLWQRELQSFLRQRSRVIGALVPPVVFWLLIGSGLGRSFTTGTPQTYLHFFFPGTVVLILLFTAIFSTISLIEDRRAGFLQGVLVAPGARTALVLGKILGGTTLALGQGLLFVAAAPLAGLRIPVTHWASVLGILVLTAMALTGLGFWLAWRLNSTQGFHAIMNIFLIPMWLLSGALFPMDGAAGWVRAVMQANPLTYAMRALQSSFYVGGQPLVGGPNDIRLGLIVSGLCAIALATICVRIVQRDA